MTNNITAGNVENCRNLIAGKFRNYGPPDCSYRLWHAGEIVQGKPNIFLVHGAVIPPGHVREAPNDCFRQLGPLLHSEFHHNVWEFEYANEYFRHHVTRKDRYFNYLDLTTYGEELIDAIRGVRKSNPDGDVTIIGHSMGGLVARYAAQNIRDVEVNKIITLDTGHLGFELAKIVDELLVDYIGSHVQSLIHCSEDAKKGSPFMQELKEGFTPGNYELVSLAAGELGVGCIFFDELGELMGVNDLGERFRGIPIADWESSSMGQVDHHGHPTNVNYNIKFEIVKKVDHLNIALITDPNKSPAYKKIISSLC